MHITSILPDSPLLFEICWPRVKVLKGPSARDPTHTWNMSSILSRFRLAMTMIAHDRKNWRLGYWKILWDHKGNVLGLSQMLQDVIIDDDLFHLTHVRVCICICMHYCKSNREPAFPFQAWLDINITIFWRVSKVLKRFYHLLSRPITAYESHQSYGCTKCFLWRFLNGIIPQTGQFKPSLDA